MYAERISRVLYYHDLADTSCRENDAVHEYDLFARHVVSEVEAGASVKAAIEGTLMYFFALEPDEIDEDRVDAVVEEIERMA